MSIRVHCTANNINTTPGHSAPTKLSFSVQPWNIEERRCEEGFEKEAWSVIKPEVDNFSKEGASGVPPDTYFQSCSIQIQSHLWKVKHTWDPNSIGFCTSRKRLRKVLTVNKKFKFSQKVWVVGCFGNVVTLLALEDSIRYIIKLALCIILGSTGTDELCTTYQECELCSTFRKVSILWLITPTIFTPVFGNLDLLLKANRFFQIPFVIYRDCGFLKLIWRVLELRLSVSSGEKLARAVWACIFRSRRNTYLEAIIRNGLRDDRGTSYCRMLCALHWACCELRWRVLMSV